MGVLKKSRAGVFLLGMMIVAVLLCCDLQAQAASEGDYSYTVTDGKAEITGYTGAGGNVSIPEALGGTPVTSIGEFAFSECTSLTTITLPEGITTIADWAFNYCSGLTIVNIPESVTSIGKSAFCRCAGLTSVTIPDGVTTIGERAFAYCSGLNSITVAVDNSTYSSKGGVLYNKAETALLACPGGLTNITIPGSVTTIGEGGFSGCSGLTTITIPDGVTTIGKGVFAGCAGLTGISIPEGVTTIGGAAFCYCSGLTSVTIPDGVTTIGDDTFSDCSGLTSVTIPDGVTTIGERAFKYCDKLTSITIPEGVTTIGGAAFYGCSGLTGITIPEGVTTIGEQTFEYCSSLTSITIPEGVTTIGIGAFACCTGLTGISIPEGVTTIGWGAFNWCSGLISITFNSATTAIYDSEDTIPAAATIKGYYPSTAKDYAAKYGQAFELIGNAPAVNIDTTGMIEFTTASSTVVDSNKEWTIILSGPVNEDSLANNIYVTDSQGVQQMTTYTVSNVDGASQIKVSPPMNGYAPGNYTLFIRDIESVNGTTIKNQVFLRFSVTNT